MPTQGPAEGWPPWPLTRAEIDAFADGDPSPVAVVGRGESHDVAGVSTTVTRVALSNEYTDPRLVALYDTVCAGREDTEFYLELATEMSASTIIDVGCGTGLLACELADRDHSVIGVDPSGAMLGVARNRSGGDRVEWIEGDATQLDGVEADLVIMTGHVAQVIADDESWQATLDADYRALRPGGRVAFESRDPCAQAWRAWTPETSRRQLEDPEIGRFDAWYQVVEVHDDLVRFGLHYLLADTGEELISSNELRFRTEPELTGSLINAGFAVEHLFGDWNRKPVGEETPELIYVASRR